MEKKEQLIPVSLLLTNCKKVFISLQPSVILFYLSCFICFINFLLLYCIKIHFQACSFSFNKHSIQFIFFVSTMMEETENIFKKVLPASQVSTATPARQKNACNLFWQGRILWLRPAVEWTVLLLLKTSKERKKIGEQAGGGKKRLGGRRPWKQFNIVQKWMD